MDEIKELAREYVDSHGEILPNFKYGFKDLKEFTTKYYFDFVFVPINLEISTKPPVVGGACGFTIDKKTLEIEDLTFSQFAMLQSNERKLNEIYTELNDTKDISKSLTWLKSTFNLTSRQVLSIKKNIATPVFEKEMVLEQINEIIKILPYN